MKGKEGYNLKGMLVGNGVADFNIDVSPSYVPTLYNFQMIPKALYDTYTTNNCFFSFRGVLPESNSTVCIDTWNEINEMTTSHVNWYDLYRPIKKRPASQRVTQENRMGTVIINGEERTYKKGFTA